MKITSMLFAILIGLQTYFVHAQTNASLKDKYDSEMYQATNWGPVTNGIEFGVQITATGPSSAEKFKVFSALYNTTSTNIYGLWNLPEGYRFEKISLKTKDGKTVQRTIDGDEICKIPRSNLSVGRVLVLESKSVTHFDQLFDVRDCFKITQAGTYTLTVKARLYSMEKYRVYSKLDLPEARVDFEITEADLKK